MADQDHQVPDQPMVHKIGEDLSMLPVRELAVRIAFLRSEVARLEALLAKKTSSGER